MKGVDIFCGAGGMSVGAKMAGINITLAIDLNPIAMKTFMFNHPETINTNCEDIRNFDFEKYNNNDYFILIGGPPCQGFSVSNTKTRNEENINNSLFYEFIRAVKELCPRWFIFENVEGIALFNKGKVLHTLREEMRKLGYITEETILMASDYGVPQNRKRFFMVGNNKNIKFTFPKKKNKKISVEQAIGDLPDLKNGDHIDELPYKNIKISSYAKMMRKKSEKSLQNYVSKNKDYVIDRYKYIRQGENWKSIPREIMGNYKNPNNCHSGIYRRLKADQPSVVIANYRKNMLIHPFQDRGLSVREAARLQGFPDDFIFQGSITHIQQQIGNAVPPLLAKAIIEQIIKLDNNYCDQKN